MDIEKQKLKVLIKELENFRAGATELVTLYVPSGYELNKAIEQIASEKSTAMNIKSKTTRKNVIAALEKILAHLRAYRKTPENGLAVFSGNVSNVEGAADVELWGIEPPEPLKQKMYRCDKVFILDALKDAFREKEIYGIIVADANEGAVGLIRGKKIEMVKEMFSLVPGKVKVGGWCVHENSLIQLADGRIKEVKDLGREHFMCYDFSSMKTVMGRHSHYFERFSNEGYKITTEAPTIVLETTPEHKMFVLTPNGIEEKRADQLKKIDLLLSVKSIKTGGKRIKTNLDQKYKFDITKQGRMFLVKQRLKNKLLQREVAKKLGITQSSISDFEIGEMNLSLENLEGLLELYKIKRKVFFSRFVKKIKTFNAPQYLNANIATIFGYLLGDGNLDSNRITFSDQDLQIIRFYKGLIDKGFGVASKINERKNKGYYELRIDNTDLRNSIEKSFPLIVKPREKEIPEEIEMLRNNELSGFLRGLFDAEGWIDKSGKTIGITMNRDIIIRKLQFLLLRFGIISSIRKIEPKNTFSKVPKYSLRITDYESTKEFSKEIGFNSKKKSMQLNRALKLKSTVSRTEQIPIRGSYILRLIRQAGMTTDDFDKVQDFFYDKKGMSYKIFKANILPVFKRKCKNRKILETLDKIVKSELIPVRIKSIEKTKSASKYYDMEIPEYSSFFANNIVVHNSQARYARIREEVLREWLQKIADVANDAFLKEKDLRGVIIAGSGMTKDAFVKDDYLHYEIKNKILGTVDTAYSGEQGMKEALEKGEELLSEASIVREKHLVERFFTELGKNTGLALYGLREIAKALELGAIEVLML